MKKISTDMAELQSMNIAEDNITKLKSLFPEAFNEGNIDFDVLKQLLGENVDENEERYGLNWHGKRQARQLALTPSRGTLRPCKNESVDWDNTKNLMIEGDNLEVLKLLQKSYAGKVKLIYIDPPYNTGKDFVYPDNFQDNMKNYLEITGQIEEGFRRSTNTETSGRYHTDWLNMIYPRLKLAKNLLRNDGIIIVSIDDSEINNLKSILDEIFGRENNLATLVWDRNRKNDAKYFSVGHEYMLVYARSESYLTECDIIFRGSKEGVDDLQNLFIQSKLKHDGDLNLIKQDIFGYYKSISKDDPRAPLKRFTKIDEKGPYRDDGNINWPGGNGPKYEVIHPKTGKPCKLPTSGWRYPTEARFWEEYEKGRIVFGNDENTVPRIRTNLFENSDQVMASVHYSYAQNSANEFSTLFNGERVFSHPKPVNDIKSLICYLTNGDDLIIDFFAGSGTTGHSIFLQNAKDSYSRRFIVVQLPEPLNKKIKEQEIAYNFCERMNRPKNIAEITKDRLRRAGKKVREDNPDRQEMSAMSPEYCNNMPSSSRLKNPYFHSIFRNPAKFFWKETLFPLVVNRIVYQGGLLLLNKAPQRVHQPHSSHKNMGFLLLYYILSLLIG